MKHAVLKSDEEIELFRREFGSRSANPLDQSYVKSGVAIGYFKKKKLVGGYIINSSFPLRYFDWIPTASNDRKEIENKFKPGQTSEITCIWMDKKIMSLAERYQLYLRLIIDTVIHSKHYVFGGSVTPKVAVIQKRVLPTVVYKGKTTLPNAPVGEIYCATRWQLAFLTFARVVYEVGAIVINKAAWIGKIVLLKPLKKLLAFDRVT